MAGNLGSLVDNLTEHCGPRERDAVQRVGVGSHDAFNTFNLCAQKATVQTERTKTKNTLIVISKRIIRVYLESAFASTQVETM